MVVRKEDVKEGQSFSCDAIAGLLDLNIAVGNLEDDYYHDQEQCTIIGRQKNYFQCCTIKE